ncbi:MAG: ATP-binding protein, partial [Anaerolineae bacterium]|nr:ATP-binding protein [Anaerolineae bacterium]
MADVQVKLTEFSDLIDGYTKEFVGREWLVDQVNDLFDKPGCRFVVLTGGAGVGKSAFMAHLAATHPRWPRYFIRHNSRELLRPGDAKTFLLTIGGQLATLYPDLFEPQRLEVIVRQRIGAVEVSGEAIGVRIAELKASPFCQVAIKVEQEIQRAAGKASGIEIGRLVT